MRTRDALLLRPIFLSLLLLAGVATAAMEGLPPGIIDYSHSTSPLRVANLAAEHTSISMEAPALTVIDSLVGLQTYQFLAIPGETFDYTDDQPAVPQITRFYRIPNTGTPELMIGELDFEVRDNDSPLINSFESARRSRETDDLSAEWYPPQVAVMSSPMIFRDFRVVAVTLYPVQVNRQLGQARVYSRIDVDIVTNDLPGENEITRPRRPSGAFAALYRSQIVNLDEDALDNATTVPGSYLILCKNEATPLRWADTLATWKRRAGYTVVVDARTSWSSQLMRTAVRNAYAQWESPLEFVCIFGDPQANLGLPTGGGDYDHMFALGNDGDDIEDVGVGRIPAATGAQFQTIIAKILGYERTPYMTDPGWFHRAFLYAGIANGISSNEIMAIWGRQQFYHHTGINNVYVSTHNGYCSNSLIGQRLTEGVSYFLWRGTVVGEMGSSAAYSMTASWKLPVVLTITCATGDFQSETCLSEHWILAGSATAPQGGVCGIGTATTNTHVPYNNTVAGGLVYNICNLAVQHLGVAVAGAKAQLYASFPGNNQAGNFTRWNNLMGDPGLSMWTDQPVVMEVTFPGTVNVGARRVSIQVVNQQSQEPIADALVVLWKGSESYSRQLTNSGGYAEVPVTVNTPGTMTLTVTKRNHKPYLADVVCVDATQMVTFSSVVLDDDTVGGSSGNGNHQLNPGEVIDLPIYLRNFGTTGEATNVTATLTSEDPRVTVLQATAGYPDVTAGDSVLADSPFRVSVSPLLSYREDVQLTLAVNAGGQLTHSAIVLVGHAGELTYSSHQVIGGDGDNLLEPGETATLRVTLRNDGDLERAGLSGTLISNTSFVSVTEANATFGSIAPQSTGNNSGHEFVLRAHSLAYPGHLANLMLVLRTPTGNVDSVAFALPLGTANSTAPTGPDAYGYYAYDNTDTAYDMSRPFSYVAINSIGTNLNLNDPGEQPSQGATYSVLRNLPFLCTFYGETFTQITVCANGWAAFGNQAEQDEFRNYPIPGQQAPDAMIAPYWDDLKTYGTNLGVWDYYDAANHQYIIQWKARGAFQNNLQDFEIILLDPEYYPTRTGDGIVVVQYNEASEMMGDGGDVYYCTLGIQAPGCTVGLQYRFYGVPAPGAASLAAGRCIVYTTETRSAFGTITGTVRDAETQQLLSGVAVSVDGHDYDDTTGADGQFTLSNVMIGTYNVRARLFGYNDGLSENVAVPMDSTVTLEFDLLHPEIRLSVDDVSITLPDDPAETFFQIINDGNGPLNYSITVRSAPPGNLDDPWDFITDIDVSQQTGDMQIQGCEWVDDHWWITGGGGPNEGRYFYLFDSEGTFSRSIPQPESSSEFGWYDLAFDGQLLYGSGGGTLQGVDRDGNVQSTITSPLNPTRAIAYDPQTDHFWVADLISDLYEISRDGTVIRRLANTQPVTGLAWNVTDPYGYRLYAFCRDTANAHAQVMRVHPVSGDRQFVAELDRTAGDRSGGCAITSGWNNTLLVFAGILQHSTGDRLAVWELAFNTTWMTVVPMIGSVGAGSSRDVSILVNPAGLRDATYRAYLLISNNSTTGDVSLPVTLTLRSTPADPRRLPPHEYALDQNFPNPFNAATTIRYDLKLSGLTMLKVYDVLGREVAEVINGFREVGSYSVSLDLDHLPSGIYVYRLHSGEFSAMRKMVLIR